MLLASVFADLHRSPDYKYFTDVDSPELPAELEEASWQACSMPTAATVALERRDINVYDIISLTISLLL
ncbi:hypothetical protein ACOSQ2_027126 [Xanthoceras sorbifolium]